MKNIEISEELLNAYRVKLVDLITFGEVNNIPTAVQYGFISWAFMVAAIEMKDKQKNEQVQTEAQESVEE